MTILTCEGVNLEGIKGENLLNSRKAHQDSNQANGDLHAETFGLLWLSFLSLSSVGSACLKLEWVFIFDLGNKGRSGNHSSLGSVVAADHSFLFPPPDLRLLPPLQAKARRYMVACHLWHTMMQWISWVMWFGTIMFCSSSLNLLAVIR